VFNRIATKVTIFSISPRAFFILIGKHTHGVIIDATGFALAVDQKNPLAFVVHHGILGRIKKGRIAKLTFADSKFLTKENLNFLMLFLAVDDFYVTKKNWQLIVNAILNMNLYLPIFTLKNGFTNQGARLIIDLNLPSWFI